MGSQAPHRPPTPHRFLCCIDLPTADAPETNAGVLRREASSLTCVSTLALSIKVFASAIKPLMAHPGSRGKPHVTSAPIRKALCPRLPTARGSLRGGVPRRSSSPGSEEQGTDAQLRGRHMAGCSQARLPPTPGLDQLEGTHSRPSQKS